MSWKRCLVLILCLITVSVVIYDVIFKESSFVNFTSAVFTKPEGPRNILTAHGTSDEHLLPGGFTISSGTSNYDSITDYVGNNEKCENNVSKSSGSLSLMKLLNSNHETKTICL